MFVDLKGRIVAVAEQKLLNPEEALLVLGKAFVQRLKIHLKAYFFIANASMTEEDWNIYHDLEGDFPVAGEDLAIAQKKGRMVLSKRILPSEVSEKEFTEFRLQHRMPLQGVDYDEEMLLNLADEELISYEKGCYLGQEIIARVHYKGKPPKKLIVDPSKGFCFIPNE